MFRKMGLVYAHCANSRGCGREQGLLVKTGAKGSITRGNEVGTSPSTKTYRLMLICLTILHDHDFLLVVRFYHLNSKKGPQPSPFVIR